MHLEAPVHESPAQHGWPDDPQCRQVPEAPHTYGSPHQPPPWPGQQGWSSPPHGTHTPD